MLDWTDRHYRYMARQISRHTWLYTEMIHAGAVVHGDALRFLNFSPIEMPLALQLGGSEPSKLAAAAKIAAEFGYNEINLNCGCPSPKVQKGAFGACLMNNVDLVAHCLNAMQDAVSIPISIKHRIGVDKQTEYQPLADFVGTLRRKTACRIFIVHARNAWLNGLSPKENREIPPLRYDYVYRLKREFPDLEIIINGGISTNAQIAEHLQHTDGVMIGREAYHNPMLMRDWDYLFYGSEHTPISHEELIHTLHAYAADQLIQNNSTILRHMVRHYLGLLHGQTGARRWRQILSDSRLQDNNADLILTAWNTAQPPL
ncbi:tRNA dihydrouridine(20/20a) synthase DusA [Stenoxybacter acetivorans]|uniref:tRNA dihydrouridine(20/20a) synthase DusA n=1 Tax=Stenoxybacter acetivorans TaxID=422441 RepID=UPI000564F6AF